MLLWVLAATALAQVVGWLAEGVRRGPHGIAIFRVAMVAPRRGGAVALVVTGRLSPRARPQPDDADAGPACSAGSSGRLAGAGASAWPCSSLLLLAAVVARRRSRRGGRCSRPMREELRLESGRYPARPTPGLGLPDDAAHRPRGDLALGPAAPWA